MGTLTSRTVELCALALQPPLELGAVPGLRVHNNVYHVKRLLRGQRPSGTCGAASGLRLGERTVTVSHSSLEKSEGWGTRPAHRDERGTSSHDAWEFFVRMSGPLGPFDPPRSPKARDRGHPPAVRPAAFGVGNERGRFLTRRWNNAKDVTLGVILLAARGCNRSKKPCTKTVLTNDQPAYRKWYPSSAAHN
jgi:hypothetical protein